MTRRIIIGSDSAGVEYKDIILRDLRADPRVGTITDIGVTPSDADACSYGEIGIRAAQSVAAGDHDRAILICGTGIGMAISANKVRGIRGTVAHDSFSVERSILSNDCQVLALGQRVIGPELARRLVKEWLSYDFDPSSGSNDKVAVITDYESKIPD